MFLKKDGVKLRTVVITQKKSLVGLLKVRQREHENPRKPYEKLEKGRF